LKAVRLFQFREELKESEIDMPKPRGKQVLLRVRGAGVCHTDLSIREGRFALKDMMKLPVTLGHEIAGVVDEVGEEVYEISRGENVVVYPWIGVDEACVYCRMGEEQHCDKPGWLGFISDGGYAEYVLVPHYRYVYRTRLDPAIASTLSCSGITAFRAFKEANLRPHETLLVVGAGGGLGTLAVGIAKARGCPKVIAVDIGEEKLKLAEEAGADHVLSGDRDTVSEEILELTEGKRGVEAVLDFVGSKSTFRVYSRILAKMGRYVKVGTMGETPDFQYPLLTQRAVRIIGTLVGNREDMLQVLKMVEAGLVKPRITKIKLEEVNEALNRLERGNISGRQVVTLA
jgi:propanol-preferring alcohol dehydrogenase